MEYRRRQVVIVALSGLLCLILIAGLREIVSSHRAKHGPPEKLEPRNQVKGDLEETADQSVRHSATNATSSATKKELDREATLLKILQDHRLVLKRLRSQDCAAASSRLGAYAQCHLLEARLWALSFPREAEGRSLELARSGADKDARYVGMFMLGVLFSQGNRNAADGLVGIALGSDPTASSDATSILIENDDAGEYKTVYIRRAGDGDGNAISALGRWTDPEIARLLEKIAKSRKDDPEISIPADRALEQLRKLSAPDWPETVTKVITRQSSQDYYINWALQVAGDRNLPGLLDLLRRRLAVAEDKYVQRFADWTEGPAPFTKRDPASLRTMMAKTSRIQDVDWYYDEVLIKYAKVGGELNELQQARLQAHGYTGDFKKRLSEIMNGQP